MTEATKLFLTNAQIVADDLGAARAKLAKVKEEITLLEDLLKAQGITEVEGNLFRVTIAYGVETTRVNWQKVANFFKPSRQLVQAHTSTGVSDRVRVTALKKH